MESKTHAEKFSKTQNDIRDLEFFIDNASSEHEYTENKKCPPFNIGTLYQRIISNLNSETAFLKEGPVTRDNYFLEDISFFTKSVE